MACVSVCVCVCARVVCLCRAEDEDSCRTARANWRNGCVLYSQSETHRLSVKLEKREEEEEEEEKKNKGEKQKSRSHVGQLSLHSDFSDFYFCTCTFEYYQLQLKCPPGDPRSVCCIKT